MEFPRGSWARAAKFGHSSVVLYVAFGKVTAPRCLGAELREAGFTVLASQSLGRGVALHLAHALPAAALALLPAPPPSHGSQTHGILLPW
jgi:hypothetical protein